MWSVVVAELRHPLPDDVAHDLLDRGIAVDAIGHSRQSDLVQRRLASFHAEALLTLGIELFTKPARTAAELRELLASVPPHHPGHHWLLETLARRTPSDANKRRVFEEHVVRYSDPTLLLRLSDVRRWAERASHPALPPDEARALHARGEPDVWRTLAKNPATPADVLAELATASGHKFARQIRVAAQRALATARRVAVG